MANCFHPVIIQRGDFLNDPNFMAARVMLETLAMEMQQANNKNTQNQSNTTHHLMSQLSAWQQASQRLENAMASPVLSDIMNTVFKLEEDHFKMLVDVRGFQPTELKLCVNNNAIEIKACREELGRGECSSGYSSRVIERTYCLPQLPQADTMQCSMSADGALFICAAWHKP